MPGALSVLPTLTHLLCAKEAALHTLTKVQPGLSYNTPFLSSPNSAQPLKHTRVGSSTQRNRNTSQKFPLRVL